MVHLHWPGVRFPFASLCRNVSSSRMLLPLEHYGVDEKLDYFPTEISVESAV